MTTEQDDTTAQQEPVVTTDEVAAAAAQADDDPMVQLARKHANTDGEAEAPPSQDSTVVDEDAIVARIAQAVVAENRKMQAAERPDALNKLTPQARLARDVSESTLNATLKELGVDAPPSDDPDFANRVFQAAYENVQERQRVAAMDDLPNRMAGIERKIDSLANAVSNQASSPSDAPAPTWSQADLNHALGIANIAMNTIVSDMNGGDMAKAAAEVAPLLTADLAAGLTRGLDRNDTTEALTSRITERAKAYIKELYSTRNGTADATAATDAVPNTANPATGVFARPGTARNGRVDYHAMPIEQLQAILISGEGNAAIADIYAERRAQGW